jgi:hypothetical protein
VQRCSQYGGVEKLWRCRGGAEEEVLRLCRSVDVQMYRGAQVQHRCRGVEVHVQRRVTEVQ